VTCIINRGRDLSRETERDSDSRRSYTTVKRYQVPDRSWEEDKVDYDKIIVKHERRVDPPPPKPRTELDFRITERGSRDYQRRDDEWHISEHMTEKEAPERDIPYRVIEREQVLAPRSSFHCPGRDPGTVPVLSPLTQERFREYRFERERDYSPPHSLHHHHHHEPEIERYRRESEYHQQPQPQPQPITIRESAPQAPIIVREERQQPSIIREERRETQQIIVRRDEPNYDFVEKGEVRNEHQSFVRREEPPPPAPIPKPQEEDYFYERRIREVDRGRDREDDIRPKDSASQYSNDDSYEYVRCERYVEGGSREGSRHRRRDLAGGALAGIAGAEIVRAHGKREGPNTGGRGRSIVGGAAVGALGAEAVGRAKSWHRGLGSRSWSGSWSGSRSRSREPRSRRKHHRSKTRARQLGGLAGGEPFGPRVRISATAQPKKTGSMSQNAAGLSVTPQHDAVAVALSYKSRDRSCDRSGDSSIRSKSTRRGGRRGSSSSSHPPSRGDPKKGQTQRHWAQAAQAAVVAGGIDKFLYRSPDEKSKLHLAEAVVVGLTANRLANGPRSKSRGQRSTPEKTIGANEAENKVQDEAAEKKNAEDDEFDEGENDVMDEDFNAEKYFDDGDDDYEDGGGGGDDDGDGYGAIGDDFDDGNDHAVGNDDATGDVNAVQALLSRWLDSSASALLLKDDEAVT
jgi:hypothetical protein